MNIKSISSENRQQINDFIISHWLSADMIVRGEVVDMTKVDGFIMFDDETIVGVITYRIIGNMCEIMSLDSLMEKHGIGTALINKIITTATEKNCTKIKLITTNDNINALLFYQKRGFDITNLYHNSIDNSRKLKPSIPMLGDFDIPIKHEIEFEMDIKSN